MIMRQLLQSLKNGQVEVADVPHPVVRPGQLLIRSTVSLISAGTERMLLDFGKASLLQKARQQPDRVREVLQKAKTDGVVATFHAVQNKLDEPIALGYCNVGKVLEVGASVDGFSVGDRVVSNGKHAEVVCVPKQLCARIPESVCDEEGVFTVLGAIGLQGMRLAHPTLGESFCVFGLGVIGLLTIQLLRSNGCRVLGVDFDAQRLALAKQFGAETADLSTDDLLSTAHTFSRGRGMDGVLITAATDSDEPVHQAAQMCRKRGRIVLVGVAGLRLSRADFYEKELSFQVSCSYGPGRYDPVYEEYGVDYPLGFVRWTEQRNFEAVLDMMVSGQLNTRPLVSHRYPLVNAPEAYALIAGSAPSLGVLLQYSEVGTLNVVQKGQATIELRPMAVRKTTFERSVRLGFVGAGSFTKHLLVPAFRHQGADLRRIAAPGGLSAFLTGRKHGFAAATSDVGSVLDDPEIDAVIVVTRHDSHAGLVCEALRRGKHVFVEKPLALSHNEMDAIEVAYAAASANRNPPILMVGFNRRFAPHVLTIRSLLASVSERKSFVMTVNAGSLPPEHWVHHPKVGGGRIVGEGCHFIDLLRFLCGFRITRLHATGFSSTGTSDPRHDQVTITLSFEDGSFGTVHYFSNGHKAVPKERLEVFCGGRILQLDNFRRLTGYGWTQFRRSRLWRMDKGHVAEAAAFLRAVRDGGPAPIPIDELFETTRVSVDVLRAARTGQMIEYGGPVLTPAASD